MNKHYTILSLLIFSLTACTGNVSVDEQYIDEEGHYHECGTAPDLTPCDEEDENHPMQSNEEMENEVEEEREEIN